MSKPDFEKTYKINNCEVSGFVKLNNLEYDKYKKKTYCLSVLINEEIGKKIQADVKDALETMSPNYRQEVKKFKRITDVLKVETDKKTGKILSKEMCPEGKLLMKLNTNSSNGRHKVLLVDRDNKPVQDLPVFKGALVHVIFKLKSYVTEADIGISTKLLAVQLVKEAEFEDEDSLKTSPFSPVEDDDLNDEYVDNKGPSLPDDEDAEEI